MVNLFNKADELSRRELMKTMAKGLLALNIVPLSAQNKSMMSGTAKAKSVIFIAVAGGLSQADSFDIKEANKDANKASSPIKSSADGIRVGKHFSKLAKHMDKCAVINSMSNTQGAHREASYLMASSYEPRGTIEHPELGAWVNKMATNNSGALPSFIKVGQSGKLGGGFFGSRYAALPVADPEKGLMHIDRPNGMSKDKFNQQFTLLTQLNREFAQKVKNQHVGSYHQVYEDALKLMNSKDLDVFDISKESNTTKEAYGKNNFGQSCLLARRLVEKGVRYIELKHGGWDHHFGIYDEFAGNAVSLDQGVAALLTDLSSKGLLDSTLVVFTTEFGRNPELNSRAGRNHYPIAYSSWLAGGGIKGGQKYGETDNLGKKVVKNKVKVGDFNATIAYALGLNLEHTETAPGGRPIKITDKGKPITSLF